MYCTVGVDCWLRVPWFPLLIICQLESVLWSWDPPLVRCVFLWIKCSQRFRNISSCKPCLRVLQGLVEVTQHDPLVDVLCSRLDPHVDVLWCRLDPPGNVLWSRLEAHNPLKWSWHLKRKACASLGALLWCLMYQLVYCFCGLCCKVS